jgi:hypothetical protein
MKDALIPLTRGHLLALGAMSVALACLSFFLGLTVANRGRAPEAEAGGVPPLVAAEVREGTLEALLARVSQQQGAELSFPGELAGPGAMSESGIPTGGWSIQVAEYPDRPSADRLVEELRAAELQAYRVSALVDGHPVQRVRVSGYATRERALTAMESVASRAGSSTPRVVAAP